MATVGKTPRGRPRATRWRMLLLALVAAAPLGLAGAGGALRAEQPRPELQRVLDRLVSGQDAIAPGAVAFVSGPTGGWLGAAGSGNPGADEPMPVGARMRLESVSKIFTAALVESLAEDGKLRLEDTVERWLPGLLPDGHRITIRHLLTMQSGLIDNNDVVNADEAAQREYVAGVRDRELRQRLAALAARASGDPSNELDPLWWVRIAAGQPLLFEPGYGVRYSNIGYDIVGLIAARAGAAPLARLFRERLFDPLELDATAYDPQGPLTGEHARGYGQYPDRSRVDATDWHYGVGADGGIVANAADTAEFLTAVMRGQLLRHRSVAGLKEGDLWLGGSGDGCGGRVYGWSGGGFGYKTEAWVDERGGRVVVLLLNGRHLGAGQASADAVAHHAALALYCET